MKAPRAFSPDQSEGDIRSVQASTPRRRLHESEVSWVMVPKKQQFGPRATVRLQLPLKVLPRRQQILLHVPPRDPVVHVADYDVVQIRGRVHRVAVRAARSRNQDHGRHLELRIRSHRDRRAPPVRRVEPHQVFATSIELVVRHGVLLRLRVVHGRLVHVAVENLGLHGVALTKELLLRRAPVPPCSKEFHPTLEAAPSRPETRHHVVQPDPIPPEELPPPTVRRVGPNLVPTQVVVCHPSRLQPLLHLPDHPIAGPRLRVRSHILGELFLQLVHSLQRRGPARGPRRGSRPPNCLVPAEVGLTSATWRHLF